ncbi:MAG TPA: hypothetical protein VIK28_03215 [Sedimentisphaerales bacterium]
MREQQEWQPKASRQTYYKGSSLILPKGFRLIRFVPNDYDAE